MPQLRLTNHQLVVFFIMTKAKEILLTKDFLENLQKEHAKLIGPERNRVTARIQAAREMGDLSENSEYDAAQDELSALEAKITEIEETLKHAKVLPEHLGNDHKVRVGSVVTVKVGSNEQVFNIVASPQADPMNNLLSEDSPVGKSLMGAKVGDEVTPPIPSKPVYKIISIESK